MFRRFNSILDECLKAVRHGEPVEAIVARYPRHARRLRPVLNLAARIQTSPRVLPRAQAHEQSWRLVRERAHQLRTGSKRVTVRRNYGLVLKPAAALIAVFLLIGSFGGGLAYASQDAMPDSPLYAVKLAGEDIRLWFVFDDTREAEILLDQSDQRVDEIRGMVSQGKTIPPNVLGALDDRNRRATGILQDKPGETALRARVLTQAQEQEDLLVALWQQVREGARDEYTEAVAFLHNTRLGGGSGEALVSVRPEDLLGGILSVSGLAQPLEGGNWSIGGLEVRVDDRTLGHTELQAGATARFVVAKSSNGRLQALSLIGGLLDSPDDNGGSAVVLGQIESITSDGISIGGQFFHISGDTLLTFPYKAGDRAQITVRMTPDGPIAQAIKPVAPAVASATVRTFTLEGTIEGDVSRSTSQWTIGGLTFEITENTAVDASAGDARHGARVQVEAVNNDGELQASRVSVLASEASAQDVAVIGTFEGYQDGEWIISGLALVPPATGADPEVESLISVDLRREGSDLAALDFVQVETAEDVGLIRTQGTIRAIDGSRWTLEFGDVRVLSTAEVAGADAGVGQRALIWSERGVDGGLEARYVRVLDDSSILNPLISEPNATTAP